MKETESQRTVLPVRQFEEIDFSICSCNHCLYHFGKLMWDRWISVNQFCAITRQSRGSVRNTIFKAEPRGEGKTFIEGNGFADAIARKDGTVLVSPAKWYGVIGTMHADKMAELRRHGR